MLKIGGDEEWVRLKEEEKEEGYGRGFEDGGSIQVVSGEREKEKKNVDGILGVSRGNCGKNGLCCQIEKIQIN
jgi:hypothetical protein